MTMPHPLPYTPEQIAEAVRITRSVAGSSRSAKKLAAVARNARLFAGRHFEGGDRRAVEREYIRNTYGDLRKIKDAARRAAIRKEARQYADSKRLTRITRTIKRV
jgi:hypothetical protein